MNHPRSPWQVLERRHLVQRTYLTLREDRVQLASGRVIDDFCVLEAPDWTAVLCITSDRQVVLVRQYRHGIASDSLELPAGALERSEAPLAGARRELAEETGYESLRWEPLLSVAVDPARQCARAHFYCALDARQTKAQNLDPSEELETLLVPSGRLLELVDSGQIIHGLHIGAIMMAARRGLL